MSQRYLGGVITANPTAPTMTTESGVWTLEQQFQYSNVWSPKIVGNSLRFRSSALAYLNRTPSGSGSNTTATFSIWVKRGALGSTQAIFACERSSAADGTTIWFDSSDKLNVGINASGGTTNGALVTTQVFRDPSAWYHIVAAIDTTQGTAANRMLLYVNGVQVTAFTTNTNPTQNSTIWVGTASLINHIGRVASSPTWFFDGYLAEYNVINGQQLTPSSFGAFDSTGVWQPLPYTGTYGTNGFYLTFADNSGTTATTLGKDYSGNGNNWTPNNISLTAGATYDWMLDTPTNFPNASTGIGNYGTINPLATGADATITNGNLSISYGTSATISTTLGSFGMTTGKWYWENTITASSLSACTAFVGMVNQSNPTGAGSYPGATSRGWSYYGNLGNFYNNGSTIQTGLATFGATNDVVGVAFDADAGTLKFYKNNTQIGTTITGIPADTYYAAWSDGSVANTFTIATNFGQRPFSYTPPSGYLALNTQNLPATTIMNGAQVMAATTYTGNGSTQNITNGGNNTIGTTFKPDFVWYKNRSIVASHNLFDSVRGVNQYLISNDTSAEGTASGVTAFNSNGFSVGSLSNGNGNGNAIVAWQWQAGQGTTSSNTSGSITSTVSVNTKAGFSVVTWTIPSGNGTVGHGLGVAPKFYIVKARNAVSNWSAWMTGFSTDDYIYLNGTAGKANAANAWGGVQPTSTTIGTNGGVLFTAGNTVVAYCWAEVAGYSAFGSYTGNGSTDGPFVYLGFRPRFVLVKRSDSTSDWRIVDTSRDTYNVMSNQLYPDLSNAEASGAIFDYLSNGFKLRQGAGGGANESGGTYIFAAFAENPFQIARAR